jgi:hypothetical protein
MVGTLTFVLPIWHPDLFCLAIEVLNERPQEFVICDIVEVNASHYDGYGINENSM